jgi:transcriptional regulator with XRE-family HTH domain
MTDVTLEGLRKAAGKTQKQAADALGITIQAYGRKEKGLRLLRAEEADTLANLFGVTPQEVIRAKRVTESDTREADDQ